ncbi:hypothetical protein TNCV_3887611 [Trichonephila clavipes]|nr:hypothetical protein TNCV_3887611 [Trichonephila clavipes]
MSFFQFQRRFLEPPTTKIVGSCYRICQTWLLEAEKLELPLFFTTSEEMEGRKPNFKEDDIVLIKEEGPPHGQWLEFFKCIQVTTD